MPKIQPDPQLRADLQSFVDRCGGNTSRAARELGVQKASLWRFLNSGAALSRTKASYRAALSRQSAESETDSARTSNATSSLARPTASKPGVIVDEASRRTIRRMCAGLTALLDAYEAALANRADTRAS